MRTLAIMRHGEVEDSDDIFADVGLTRAGRGQSFRRAGELAQVFGGTKPFVGHSPLLRTTQTAQIVANRFMGRFNFKKGHITPLNDLHEANQLGFAQGPGQHIPNDVQNVLLVTHMPNSINYTKELMGEDFFHPLGSEPVEHLHENLGGAEAVVMRFDSGDWNTLGKPNSYEFLRNGL